MKFDRITGIIALVLLTIIAGSLVHSEFGRNHHSKLNADRAHEAEVKYFSSLSDLADEVQAYIISVAPSSNLRALDLIEKCFEYNVDLKFVLAQGKLESNFGTAGMAAKTNSVWNVGAFDGAGYEKIDGSYKYRHPNDAIVPYLKLLNTRYLLNRSEMDLMLEYVDCNGQRYATEPTYEKRLHAIYDTLCNETRINELESMVRHYKVEYGR